LGNGTRLLTGITVNGLLRNIGACITTPITVNSGGTYREECGGFHNSTLTINAGGNYVQQGTLGIGDIFLASGVHISTGAASPNGAVVGNPGDLYLDTTRGTNSTLFVKESGVGTNTGWSAK
jgi:hypothetical protein